jgi:hypothetical protein
VLGSGVDADIGFRPVFDLLIAPSLLPRTESGQERDIGFTSRCLAAMHRQVPSEFHNPGSGIEATGAAYRRGLQQDSGLRMPPSDT